MIYMERTLYKSILKRYDKIPHNCIVCKEPMGTYRNKNITFCRIVHWGCHI